MLDLFCQPFSVRRGLGNKELNFIVVRLWVVFKGNLLVVFAELNANLLIPSIIVLLLYSERAKPDSES